MPVEPIEAEFASPPILSEKQERQFRDEPLEGANLSKNSSTHTVVGDIEQFGAEKKKIVSFEVGTREDPREWAKSKKWFLTVSNSLLCLAVALGSSIVTGDLAGAAEELGVSEEVINLSVTLFVVGFGVGPLLFAPLSEVVGRKPIYCISIFFFFIFTLPSALAQNIATMLVARLIAGIAASAPMTNVGGSMSDIWSVEERGIPMAVFSGTIFMGPCLGPLFGGWIGQRAGWRWIYWTLFIFDGVVFALTLVLPETLASVLLKRKAARLRKETGDSSYVSHEEIKPVPFAKTLQIAIMRPFIMMFLEPIVLFMSIYLSFVYALLYLLFFAFPIAFAEIRGFGMGITGTTFVSIIVGITLAMCLMPLQEKVYARATRDGPRAEGRLFPMMVGAIVLPSALFIFAFTGAYSWVHWMGPAVAGAMFGFAMILLYVSANSYIVDSYSNFAASAIAAKTFMRSLVGASVPLWVNQMFHNMGFQYAGLLLALIACAIGPIPFLFFKFGASIRMRSKRATN